jgi:hypothetical protein
VTTLGSSVRGPGLELETTERESASQGTEEAAEKWAGLLAATLCAKLPPPPPPAVFGTPPEASPAGAWRSGDGSLTQAQAAAPSVAEGSTDNSSRITLTVDGADLGELNVLIDRTKDGVRVLIGVDGSHAERAIDPQTAALARALASVGVAVSSVTVVRRESLGTDLAQRTEKPKPPADDKSEHGAHGSKHRKRRINLVG